MSEFLVLDKLDRLVGFASIFSLDLVGVGLFLVSLHDGLFDFHVSHCLAISMRVVLTLRSMYEVVMWWLKLERSNCTDVQVFQGQSLQVLEYWRSRWLLDEGWLT